MIAFVHDIIIFLIIIPYPLTVVNRILRGADYLWFVEDGRVQWSEVHKGEGANGIFHEDNDERKRKKGIPEVVGKEDDTEITSEQIERVKQKRLFMIKGEFSRKSKMIQRNLAMKMFQILTELVIHHCMQKMMIKWLRPQK